MTLITPQDNEMSSGAASRARQLLAAKETDSLLILKERLAVTPITTPTNVGASSCCSPPRLQRTAEHHVLPAHVIDPTEEEESSSSSSRARTILSSMKEKRENFSSRVKSAKTPGSHTRSHDESPNESTPPRSSGKPPRFTTSFEREELTNKMSQSLKEKRDRITRLLSRDHQKIQVVSRSPLTVETESTTEDTTEDSHSTGSWSADNATTHQIMEEHTKPASPPLQEIEEDFEHEEGSVDKLDEGASSSTQEKDEPHHYNRPLADEKTGHFMPIGSNGPETENYGSMESGQDGDEEEGEPGEPNHAVRIPAQCSGDKKVSFGDTFVFMDEITPPAVVHCTSFDSGFSKD